MMHKVMLRSLIHTQIHRTKHSVSSIMKTDPTVTTVLQITTSEGTSSGQKCLVKALLAATVEFRRIAMTLLSFG
jgi:hypothetical protein